MEAKNGNVSCPRTCNQQISDLISSFGRVSLTQTLYQAWKITPNPKEVEHGVQGGSDNLKNKVTRESIC